MKFGNALSIRTEYISVSRLLFLSYSLFLLGYFIVPKVFEGKHYKVYYVLIVVLSLIKARAGLRLLRNDALFLMLTLYLVYMLLSVTWSEAFFSDPTFIKDTWVHLKHTFHIVIFFLATAVLRDEYPSQFNRLLEITCFVAAGAAIVAVLLWYQAHPFPKAAVHGFTLMHNPNDNAFVYGLFCVLSASYLFSARTLGARIAWSLAFVILLCFVLLTQSRTGLAATIIATLVLLLGATPRTGVRVVLPLAAALLLLLFFFPDAPGYLANKGLSYRVEIWSAVLEQVAQAPFFGHGYLANARVAGPPMPTDYHAHSAFLATLRDGGLIGLSLLLILFAYAFWRSVRIGMDSGDYTYLALLLFGVICITTGGDRLIDRPKEPWIFLWLPLALLVTQQAAQTRSRP